MPTSFFHGVTVTLIDTGPRPIAIPSSSIVGLVDTYTPAEGLSCTFFSTTPFSHPDATLQRSGSNR